MCSIWPGGIRTQELTSYIYISTLTYSVLFQVVLDMLGYAHSTPLLKKACPQVAT